MSRATRFGAAALACAAAAGWLSFDYTGRAERQAGPPRAVLVALRPLEAGAGADAIAASTALRSVPAAYAPSDAIGDPADAAGSLVTALPAGAYLTRSALSGAQAGGGFRLRPGERAVTVDAVVSPAGRELAPGARVDIYASGFGGDERTVEVVAAAELLAVEDGSAAGRVRATLRLASAQVPAVVRADVFARELRAVARPGG